MANVNTLALEVSEGRGEKLSLLEMLFESVSTDREVF